MQHEDSYEDDWKEEAPLLASLKKEADFDLSEDYFASMNQNVLARIRKEEAADDQQNVPTLRFNVVTEAEVILPQAVSPWRRTIFWSVAAGIALLAIVGTYFLRKNDLQEGAIFAEEQIRKETLVQLASLDSKEITPHIDITDVTDEQLFEALGSEAEAAFEGEDHEIQQDEAAEYLEEVNLDEIDWKELDIDLDDLQ
jgi:hypothetical protein